MIETCPICKTAIMSAVLCPKYDKSIHAKHCFSCQHFNELTFRCTFLPHPAERWEKAREKFLTERRQKLIYKWYKRNS